MELLRPRTAKYVEEDCEMCARGRRWRESRERGSLRRR